MSKYNPQHLIWHPRYTKGLSCLSRHPPSHIPHVFSKFNFAPDALPKYLHEVKAIGIDCIEVHTKVVSSAYWVMRTLPSWPGSFRPWKLTHFLALFAKGSIDNTYNRGDMAQPCLTLLHTRKLSPMWPVTITALLMFVYKSLIHLIKDGPKP